MPDGPAPQPAKKSLFARWWFWVIVAVVIIVAVGAVAQLGRGTDDASTAPSDSETDTSAEVAPVEEPIAVPETEAPTALGIGDVATDGDVDFVINDFFYTTEPISDDTYAPLAPTGQYAVANISATATSSIGMYLGEVTAILEDGSSVSPSVGAMMYAGTLNPAAIEDGQTLTGDVIFDIPVDATVVGFVLQENPLTDGVSVYAE